MSLALARRHDPAPVVYPDSDGLPMADNTEQFEFIRDTQANLDSFIPDFVAGNHLWYPVQGRPDIRMGPDVFVALGRPKGHRGSYRQWVENGVAPQVVFEWWSPNSSFSAEVAKLRFYERYGVEEFYTWNQTASVFSAFIRKNGALEVVNTEGGWVSPLLGVRFEVVHDTLRMYRPSGEPFSSLAEMEAERNRLAMENVVAEKDRKEAMKKQREAEQAREEAERSREEAERSREEAERGREEAAQARLDAESRARALAERLRALGIDPDAA